MIIVVARIEVDPASIPRLRPLLDRIMQFTWEASGCLSYSFSVESETDGILSLVERWEDEAALRAYLGTPTMVEFKAAIDAEQVTIDAHVYDVTGERPLREAMTKAAGPALYVVGGGANGISAA